MTGTLFAEVDGEGAGPRVVLVHGFTQTRDCWGDLPPRLVGAGHEVMRVDLPGHGRSAHASASLVEAADLLVATAGEAVYLGYSFGARVCLHAALAHPNDVTALVLIGGTPGLRAPEERAVRRADDEALAARIEAIGVPAFLEEWISQPLFAQLPPEQVFLEARCENTPAGLAASLRACGTGTQEPLWDRLPSLSMPVLCVTGADDAKFTAIATEMAATTGPNATHVTVPAAGHTAHLERPAAFWTVLAPWLAAH